MTRGQAGNSRPWSPAARRGDRGDPRRGLQPHRRGRRHRPDAVAARAGQPAITGSPAAGAITSTTPAPATRSTCRPPDGAAHGAGQPALLGRGDGGRRVPLRPVPARWGGRITASTAARRSSTRSAQDPVLRRGQADRRAVGHRPGRLPAGRVPAAVRMEWNDKFRDGVRRFWRGDRGTCRDLADRLMGSARSSTATGGATASVNLPHRP